MSDSKPFTNSISITSQFPFCSLPIRLDSYRGCAIGCTYCFAATRGGNVPTSRIAAADPQILASELERAKIAAPNSAPLRQMLHRRVPIHFGGMSDPFQPAEKKWGVTAQMLRALGLHNYPTVISTKSNLCCESSYVDLLKQIGNVVVQFSFSTLKADVAARVEPNSMGPSALLRAMEYLSARGINVTCRWQPYIPGLSEDPVEFVPVVARAGARHIAIEHLKVPTERNLRLLDGKSNADMLNARSAYVALEARRDGREYVLNAESKIETALMTREVCHAHSMTFGAGDNELQYLSDTEGCCSGVDQFAGFENVFRFNIATAVRRSRAAEILFSAIADEWRPTGSIDRFMNSRSRLGKRLGVSGSIEDHVRYRWNAEGAAGNPITFFGVQSGAKLDKDGMNVYSWARRL